MPKILSAVFIFMQTQDQPSQLDRCAKTFLTLGLSVIAVKHAENCLALSLLAETKYDCIIHKKRWRLGLI
jgi:hypothetical protein